MYRRNLPNLRGARVLASSAVLAAVFWILYQYVRWSTTLDGAARFSRDAIHDIQNATLGFGALVLISLDFRTDRRDALTLITSTSDLEITKVVNGVRSEDIHDKGYPFGGWQTNPLWDMAKLGSWRSHMNALKYIVDNKIETALILEDDVDWDVHVKSQLSSFALALRNSNLRSPYTPEEIQNAPYGLDWDTLHLGTSLSEMAPAPFDDLYALYHDPHRTPPEVIAHKGACGEKDWYCWADIMTHTACNDTSRVLYPSYGSVGLVAFAVTLKGAQKLLYELSWVGLNNTVDYSIRGLHMDGSLHGWTVTPPIMSSWVTGDGADSDLTNGGKGRTVAKHSNLGGKGKGLGWSVRKALTENLSGGNYWKSEEAKLWGPRLGG
ncbi:hypothetical protein YB2330_003581 [Saitoella coloradoensis]